MAPLRIIAIPILFVLFSVSGTDADTWDYTLIGNATDGQPCLTNCKNNKCIVSWNGNVKDCRTNNQPAPKYRTAQFVDKTSQYCLSNCGYFGFSYQWCVTTSQKGWDYCNAELYDASIYRKRCTSPCHKGQSDYYWCFLEHSNQWQYCALGREESGSEFDIDPRYASDSENRV